MSKKFIRALGISLIIILLPVLIVTSAVALDRSANNNTDDPSNNGDNTVISCIVDSVYGTDEKVVYNAEKDVWTFEELPTRQFYTLKGVSIEGQEGFFEINTNKELVLGSKKDTFMNAVLAEKKIESVWTCDFSDIIIETGTFWQLYGKKFSGSVTCWGASMDKIEEIMLLDLVCYNYEKYPLNNILIKTLNAEGDYIAEPITLSYDTSVDGDLSVAEFLTMIQVKNIPLNTIEPNVLKVMLYN